jgi:phosphate:Na+ symporter
MQQSFITIGMLMGGLGLFLLAVKMITDGLKLAAGRALLGILNKWTRSPAHGIFTGLTITAIVQSSSAVTVATIGFVNAGLINLYQALGIVYGTNIGTTMTAWLVAIIGFKIKVEVFALPMIGIGVFLHLINNNTRWASLGMALAGFGLFFMGIDVLKNAFEGIATVLELQRFTIDGVAAVLLYLFIGFLMTVVTQSSSAAIAITLTAATGGVLGLYAAAAMIIGANVGTTSTAGLAVIGATPNAKRVASAHVIFNVVTGCVALITLPLLFFIVKSTGRLLGLEDIPAITLALFHTVFNILGVLLILPFSKKMTRFLEKCFITQEEIEGKPQFLDTNIVASPILAIHALAMELSRITMVIRRMSLATLSLESSSGNGNSLRIDHVIVKKLANAVARFISQLGRGTLTKEISLDMSKLLRAEQHLLACADQCIEIMRTQADMISIEDEELIEKVGHYRSEVARLIELAVPDSEDFSLDACEAQLEHVQIAYEDTKSILILAGAELRTPIPGVIDTLELNSQIRRMARQLFKAIRYLNGMYIITGEQLDNDGNNIDILDKESIE